MLKISSVLLSLLSHRDCSSIKSVQKIRRIQIKKELLRHTSRGLIFEFLLDEPFAPNIWPLNRASSRMTGARCVYVPNTIVTAQLQRVLCVIEHTHSRFLNAIALTRANLEPMRILHAFWSGTKDAISAQNNKARLRSADSRSSMLLVPLVSSLAQKEATIPGAIARLQITRTLTDMGCYARKRVLSITPDALLRLLGCINPE